MTGDRFSICWWNTSLSPRGQDSTEVDHLNFAYSVIREIISSVSADILILCEVSEQTVTSIVANCDLTGFKIAPKPADSSSLKFDMCLIYRESKFLVMGSRSIVDASSTATLRVAQYYSLALSGEGEPLHLFVSHWPSRMFLPENHSRRNLLGTRLRDAALELYTTDRENPQVIFAGDYNDEPFNTSLSESLFATRDRQLAKKRPKSFYNPFWRHLNYLAIGKQHGESENGSCGGTYFYRNGINTNWYTFDQIMVSPSLAAGIHKWFLKEELCTILIAQNHLDLITSTKSNFDHLPIMAAFEKGE